MGWGHEEQLTASSEDVVDLLKSGAGRVVGKLDDVAHGLESSEASWWGSRGGILADSEGVTGRVLELDLESTVGLL